MFRNVLRMVSELTKTTIVPLHSGDGEKKKQPSIGGFEGGSLQVL